MRRSQTPIAGRSTDVQEEAHDDRTDRTPEGTDRESRQPPSNNTRTCNKLLGVYM